ncbi:MAG: lyase family protein, partial [Pirellulales bacterium]|nr:lyase family protein [Pirellulales bacterium]
GLDLLMQRLVSVIDKLATFAARYQDMPCLAFTHLQPAQPTTVGKRTTLWIYDLVLDLAELEHRRETLRARGVKGTTGTQASFLQLFDGDHFKVRELDRRVTQKMGFAASYEVTGQTYPRKVDAMILDALAGIAQSCQKFATDLRLLAARKELEEPFETQQIGSSAMAYKRNPMRAERMCGLARYAISLAENTAQTAATQWMERTLDDSANRRLVIPQAFLAVESILILYENIAAGLVVYPRVIERNLREELPFMATESLLMAAVSAGGDRQELHERIRLASVEAAKQVKEQGLPNDLLERLKRDPDFAGIDLNAAMETSQFTGRAGQQTREFLDEVVGPIRQKYRHHAALAAEVRV